MFQFHFPQLYNTCRLLGFVPPCVVVGCVWHVVCEEYLRASLYVLVCQNISLGLAKPPKLNWIAKARSLITTLLTGFPLVTALVLLLLLFFSLLVVLFAALGVQTPGLKKPSYFSHTLTSDQCVTIIILFFSWIQYQLPNLFDRVYFSSGVL